jgi:YD repeat-containing protein
VYDAAARLIKSTDADLTTAEYRYDPVGNLILEKKRDNTVVARVYDGLSRLCEVRTFPLGATAFADLNLASLPANTLQQKFVYDSYSRLLQAIDYNADGTASPHTVDFEYDANGNPVLETQDTDAPVKVVYDAAGNPVELHYPDTENPGDCLGHVSIGRDEAHRPDQISWTLAGSATVESICDYTEYNGRNEPVMATIGSDIEFSRQLLAPGQELQRSYAWITGNPENRPRIIYERTGDLVEYDEGKWTIDPDFNALGNPNTGWRKYAQMAAPASYAWKIENSFVYDPRARLDNADETVTFDENTSVDTRTWQLDKVGNWDTTDAGNWTPNADNEYTATPHGSPIYDVNGNLTGFGGRTFIYDWANRLVEVKTGETAVATYSYDALGRRVTKATSGVSIRYIHSGSQVIEELTDTGSGYSLAKTYIHSTSIDRPLAVKHWSAGAVTDTYYFLADRQGNILALMKDNGASASTIVETYSYTPYGERRIYHYDLDYGGGQGIGKRTVDAG